MTQETDHAKRQAAAQIETIVELMTALDAAEENGTAAYDGEELDAEQVRERIQEDVLSVDVRSAWHVPGNDSRAAEYLLLLCTGGPAVRIVGELDLYGEADSANVEYEDWGTPWMRYTEADAETDALILRFAQQFYYGG